LLIDLQAEEITGVVEGADLAPAVAGVSHGPNGSRDEGIEEMRPISLGIYLFALGVGQDDARQAEAVSDREEGRMADILNGRVAQRRHVEARGDGSTIVNV
jgi:hypothetical protein